MWYDVFNRETPPSRARRISFWQHDLGENVRCCWLEQCVSRELLGSKWKLGGGFKCFIYYFHPYLKGQDFQFDEPIYFSDGLVQPPTRKSYWMHWKIWFSSLDSGAFCLRRIGHLQTFVAFVARRRWRWTTFCWSFWASLNHLVCSGTHATR